MYPGFVFTLDGGMYVLALCLTLCFAYMAHRDKRLNLLYNTLDFPDYGSSSNLCGAKKSNPGADKSIPGAVKSGEANGDISGADQPPVLEKRLSRISEDGIERMSVCNSKWARNDSSSTDSFSEVCATDSTTKQATTTMTKTGNSSSQTANGPTKMTNGNIPTSK
jgi:hypothetical protein